MLDDIEELAWEYLTETVIEYYSLERKDLEGIKIVNGKLNFEPKQTKMFQTVYVNCVKHGEHIEWQVDGSIRKKCNYVNGVLHGSCVEYYGGYVIEKYYYVNGRLSGPYEKISKAGVLLEKGQYADIDNNPSREPWDGLHETWNSSGIKLLSENFKSGYRHGPCYEWYDRNVIKKKSYYYNGLQIGSEKTWFILGPKNSTFRYVNGERHGAHYKWGRGVLVKKGYYRYGKLHGQSIAYYKNGLQKTLTTFVNGVTYGEHKKWDKDGVMVEHCYYFGDEDDGYELKIQY